MYQLYKGDTPLATFVPKDASELPYSNGVSVKDKIDIVDEKFITANSAEYTETVGASTQTIISVPNPAPAGYTLINAYVDIGRVTGSWYLSAFYNRYVQHVFIHNYGSASNDVTFVVRFLYKKN